MRAERPAVGRQDLPHLVPLEQRTTHDHGQAEPRRDLHATTGGEHVQRDRASGVGTDGHLAVALQQAPELAQVGLEGVGRLGALPQGSAYRRGEAQRATDAEIDACPGAAPSSIRNCSATTSGWWCGSITPPDPSRIADVRAPIAASSTGGDPEATPGTPWCSATQNRS